jgi:DNA mismatch repair protein MutS2
VTFRVSRRTLEQLEWPLLVEQLRELTQTPRGRARCARDDAGRGLFEPNADAVRERLAETSEARRLLDAGDAPALGSVADLDAALRRAGKGGVLAARELLDLRSTLSALTATRRALRRNAEPAQRLAELGERLADLRDLDEEIAYSIDSDGEVRGHASAALAQSRRDARDLAASLQRRLERYLRDPRVSDCLSDDFYTVRNDRYVLPVRADARGGVPGIVHDASSSGTTVFIEPEAVVDLNNRLKTAEIEIERETLRVLRRLARCVVERLPEIESGVEVLEQIDLAFARGRLSQRMNAVEPSLGPDGSFELYALRHPLLPVDSAVPNDIRLWDGPSVLLISGPNAGGKTVAMKAVAIAALSVRAGLHVAALPGSRMGVVDAVLADIGDEQDLRESLSTFSAHMANLARIVESASSRCLVILDEIGAGTDPSEGASLAQAILETLAETGARVIATTHYSLLKEMASADPRFLNASVELDEETLAPTYRLHLGTPGTSSATAVAGRMGLRPEVLERANALLEREDRQLDRLLVELSANRVALETERREARRLRAETETARDEYRHKLERLQERRDQLFRSLRDDLEAGRLRASDCSRSRTARSRSKRPSWVRRKRRPISSIGAMRSPGRRSGSGVAARPCCSRSRIDAGAPRCAWEARASWLPRTSSLRPTQPGRRRASATTSASSPREPRRDAGRTPSTTPRVATCADCASRRRSTARSSPSIAPPARGAVA